MSEELTGKVAIVTGAGHGIGRATALQLAAMGASVVVNDLGGDTGGKGASTGAADATVKEIVARGGAAIADYGSVADHQAAQRMVRSALDAFGRLDVLVNNAGNMRHGPIWELSEEDFDAVVAVHLKGAYNTIRHACEPMMRQRSGRIVNLFARSIGLYRAGHSCYSAAKSGLWGFTCALAAELGPYGVTVNCVAPGPTDSRMAANFARQARSPEGIKDPVLRRNAFLGIADPVDIATFIGYLATDDAGDVNGQAFHCYGPHISRFPNPEPVNALYKEGHWTVDELKRQFPIVHRAALDNPAPPEDAGAGIDTR
ncbi:MAG: SDR family NAD(P)-dependent oxidoreductase [Chloroflexi bacterium]|nr:SDR family NAD(P)-dependent oxidoreductase [Chloroflexota bacterium]